MRLAAWVADGRVEAAEVVSALRLDLADSEPVPQEDEGGVLARATPLAVLAGPDAGLTGMQRQPCARIQPLRDRGPDPVRFALAAAVDHYIVAVPFNRYPRVLAGHPRVERVVQEQVGGQRADR